MKHTKMHTLIISSIGLLCAVYIGFSVDSQSNRAFAATDVKSQLLKSLNQNISDVSIKSSNTNKDIAKIGDVVTINYTLNKIPTKNTVLIDYQTITPVCERDVLIQKCSAAIIITKSFPINDGMIQFSIDVMFRDGKSEIKTTVDDKTFVDVQRGNSLTTKAIVDEKATPLAVSATPTLATVLKLNTIAVNPPKTPVSTKASPDQLKSILEKRKEIMIALAKQKPIEYIYGMFPAEIAKKISLSFPELIEKNVTETGILEVIHVDDFKDEKNSHFLYILRQGEKVIPLYSVEALNRTSGDVITVTGSKLGDAIVLKSTNQITIANKPVPVTIKNDIESVGRQNTLVFLIRFPDSRPIPFSSRTAHRLIFGGQFQKFFKEQSYGKTSFSGRVIDWETMNRRPGSNTGDACGTGVDLYGREIQNVLADNNINLNDYSRVLYLIDGASGGCSYVGMGTHLIDNVVYRLSESWVGISDYNINSYWGNQPFSWTNLDQVTSHEMGHALGVFHANGWECGETSLRGDCEHMEYGNLFDIMGGTTYSLHFNAFYKELLGWIKPSETETITSSGIYTIKPLENWLFSFFQNLNGVKRIAKIKVANSDSIPFYLEYRKSLGFDRGLGRTEFVSNTNGLFVNYIIKGQWGNTFSRLLDMTPHKVEYNTWSNNYQQDLKDTTLNGNSIFTDTDTGISVGPIVQNTNSKITFKVNITDPICTRRLPSIIETQVGGWAGYLGYVYVNFYNTDSITCGDSDFYINNLVLPLGWSEYQINTVVTPPEQNRFLGGSYQIPSNAISGNSYPISFDLVNRSSGMRKSIQTTIQVQ